MCFHWGLNASMKDIFILANKHLGTLEHDIHHYHSLWNDFTSYLCWDVHHLKALKAKKGNASVRQKLNVLILKISPKTLSSCIIIKVILLGQWGKYKTKTKHVSFAWINWLLLYLF